MRFDSKVTFQPRSRALRACGGFTLTELLIVISVGLVLLGSGLVAGRGVMRDAKRSQAVNMISAYVARARALALSQHRHAGVVFYYGPLVNRSTGLYSFTGTTYNYIANPPILMQLVVEVISPATTPHVMNVPLTALSSEPAQSLPDGIGVSALTDGANFYSSVNNSGNFSAQWTRAVVFSPAGELTGVGAIDYSSSPKLWSFSTSAITVFDATTLSSPGLAIFDDVDFRTQASLASATQATLKSWLNSQATTILFNPNTGNVIR